MMVGLSLFKSGFIAGRSRGRTYAIIFTLGMIALAMVAWLAWRKDVAELPVRGGDSIGFFLTPLVSLAYASGLILLLRTGASSLLSPVAAAGRMAFTNYLTQSLIMTSIFYGGRGGLMGKIDRPGLWVIVVALWVTADLVPDLAVTIRHGAVRMDVALSDLWPVRSVPETRTRTFGLSLRDVVGINDSYFAEDRR